MAWMVFIMEKLFFTRASTAGAFRAIFALNGLDGNAHIALLICLGLVLTALAVQVGFVAAHMLLNRHSQARLFRTAMRPAAGGARAMVVVKLLGLRRLPAAKLKGAMKSLGFYLPSFIREGEACERTGRREYGLLLYCGDDAAFSRRIAVLRQDLGFLYMAAYPGLLKARVAFCRLSDAASVREALRRAGRAPEETA